MPFGGNDWLGLTLEPTLEPVIPICDPHHHFWDCRSERTPYQRYLLDELIADIHSGHNVRSTVFVEAGAMYRAEGPEELRSVGEVEFVQALAAAGASGLYGPGRAAAAIVGHANLNLGERVAPVLDALQAASPNRFRGIRHIVKWDPHPEVANSAPHKRKGQPSSDLFRKGARVLARRGLSFEGCIYFPQLTELADFAKAVPDLTIILNHIGGLVRIGPILQTGITKCWLPGGAASLPCQHAPTSTSSSVASACPARVLIGMPGKTPIGSAELAALMAPLMTYCIEQFGPARCMFESNFPVDKVSYSYNVLYNAFKRLSTGYSARRACRDVP